jgi:hypothetical protein
MMEIKSKINQPFRYTLMIFYIKRWIIKYPYSAFIYNLHVFSVVCAEKVEENIKNEECVDELVRIIGLIPLISTVESKQIRG